MENAVMHMPEVVQGLMNPMRLKGFYGGRGGTITPGLGPVGGGGGAGSGYTTAASGETATGHRLKRIASLNEFNREVLLETSGGSGEGGGPSSAVPRQGGRLGPILSARPPM